ncbi:MAG: hypothetical protein WC889_02830 [Myxococcota bacterium]|jgi:hypothetical protein
MGIARQLETQQTHYLRRDIAFNTTGIATGVLIGTVPAGAKLTQVLIHIDTAFNAGTTNVLQGGVTGVGTTLFTTTEAAAGTAGVKVATDSATQGRGLEFAADTDLFVSYTQTGTAATTGVATITVEYIPLSNGG